MKNPPSRCFGSLPWRCLRVLTSTSSAQKGTAMSKAQAIAQQLNLTPQQKEKVLPILIAEGPKVQAIKSDNSLSKVQKIQQIKAIHHQTDPQMKAILSPEQYQKLQTIRQQTIRDAYKSALGLSDGHRAVPSRSQSVSLIALCAECAALDAQSTRKEQSAIVVSRTGFLVRSVLSEELYITTAFA